MSLQNINGNDFINMVMAGAARLQQYQNRVNELNVFPVPDGDTGSNMNRTMDSGSRQLKQQGGVHIGQNAEIFSKGLLMGARGNSGVILSQLFRGFGKSVAAYDAIGPVQLANALQSGVETAYKAVIKPVEGTILTVAKDTAEAAVRLAEQHTDLLSMMEQVLAAAQQSLERTPELLPVLKQVGVVDSGGQGLVYIYEGFVQALKGEFTDDALSSVYLHDSAENHQNRQTNAQSQLQTADIEHFYDMEFFILPDQSKELVISSSELSDKLNKLGDSVVLIADDDMVKVHVHSNAPGEVLSYVLQFGELSQIHVQNMRDQHRAIVSDSAQAEFGILAVCSGKGMADIFKSLGKVEVLSGGQTMNPSTEDLVQAISAMGTKHVFILPNNSNIILSAKQAAELVEAKVSVIPTKSIPQGIAAILSFDDAVKPEENENRMMAAAQRIKSGEVTYAIRDSSIDGLIIKENDYIGLAEGKIVAAEEQLLTACQQLLQHMLEDEGEILTIFSGEEADEQMTEQLREYMENHFPAVEIDIQQGSQPLYYYIFSVE